MAAIGLGLFLYAIIADHANGTLHRPHSPWWISWPGTLGVILIAASCLVCLWKYLP